MSLKLLRKNLKAKNIKVVFTDYYDTIIHRTVHPNYALRLWAKFLIKECGLKASIDELYFIRNSVNKHLNSELEKDVLEIPYEALKEAVFRRMVNQGILSGYSKQRFFDLFEKADLKAETKVQYLNQGVVDVLKDFKANGGRVYLVSDFYGSKSLFLSLLKHHGIFDVFADVFSSAQLEASKASGTIFNKLTDLLQISPKEVMMIGDNKRSDFENATKYGLNAYLLPHRKHLRRNRLNALGNDSKVLKTILNDTYSDCTEKSVMPFVEYIIFYHFFVERLYDKCKREKIKNLFFLSREGMYLKRLFDAYQDHHLIDSNNETKTHYIKISRQASMQIKLKALDEETFEYLRLKYPSIDLENFLVFFNCPQATKETIKKELDSANNSTGDDFFNSELFQKLKENAAFKDFYKNHRISSRANFNKYIDSFGANYREEGIYLVDIGWGGTMQESIYAFFDGAIPVTGYYLGIRDIYNLQEKTKRYGLLFSILPYSDYNDYLLMSNAQYYEQFSGANHGSALGYTTESDGFVLEKHNPQEKWLYDTYIKAHQEEMFDFHATLMKALDPVCYNQCMAQNILSKLALKTALFVNTRKLKFIQELNNSFYQNIGTNKVGLAYEMEEGHSIMGYIKTFMLTPETLLRYITKLKPVLYRKNKLLAVLTPAYLIYWHYRVNRFVRFNWLKNSFLLKYIFFKTDKII